MSLEEEILENQLALLNPLLSRTVSHGILPSRYLNMKKSALLSTRVVVLSFGFVPSLQDPELHNLVVIATKTALNVTT